MEQVDCALNIANLVITLWDEGMYIPDIARKVGLEEETVKLMLDRKLLERQMRKEVFSPGFAEV